MVWVNGEQVNGWEGRTLGELLAGLGLDGARIAVECNGGVLPSARWDEYRLAEADRLEVVQFMGGG